MKIYIISSYLEDSIEISKKVSSNIEDIANTFMTNSEYSSKDMSENCMYYISEEQLSLDFKNNSLLYVITDNDNENSIGISIDEVYSKEIIPVSIKAFNLIHTNNLNDCLIVWYDTKLDKKCHSKVDNYINTIESKYLLENIKEYKDRFLYFNYMDSPEYIKDTIYSFITGDEDIRNSILLENN